MKLVLIVASIVSLACSVTRPTALPTPAVGEGGRTVYRALLVTDSSGRTRWVYDAWVDRDTLWGRRNPQVSRERIALPISAVRAVAAPRFSTARTVGLISGLAALVGVAVLLAPDPVYSLGYR